MVFSDLRSLLRFFWLVAFALLMLLKEKGPYLPLLVDRMLTRVCLNFIFKKCFSFSTCKQLNMVARTVGGGW